MKPPKQPVRNSAGAGERGQGGAGREESGCSVGSRAKSFFLLACLYLCVCVCVCVYFKLVSFLLDYS